MLEEKFLSDEAATIAAAQALAPRLTAGQTLLLTGDLGAGKSTFARALIRALPLGDGSLRADEAVPSPTYTLLQTYERAIGTVSHFDLYRLDTPEEVYELGLEEALGAGLCLIEWPERLGRFLPPRALRLTLTPQAEGRFYHLADAAGS